MTDAIADSQIRSVEKILEDLGNRFVSQADEIETLKDALAEAQTEIAGLEDALADHEINGERLAAAVWVHVDRHHHEQGHRGLVRFCTEPGCDGWDLVFRDESLAWPPL